MDYNALYHYAPYTGGAGPDEETVRRCLRQLYAALLNLGLKASIEANEDDLCVMVGDLRVQYDRWGYVNVDANPSVELDQVDLNTAVAYFLENAK